MASPNSSVVVLSGYHLIEVTDSDFRKTVVRGKYDTNEKKKHIPHKFLHIVNNTIFYVAMSSGII
jgi:hypothetical protein